LLKHRLTVDAWRPGIPAHARRCLLAIRQALNICL
jgi:hypothetical protein